jgi:hypothetical protein
MAPPKRFDTSASQREAWGSFHSWCSWCFRPSEGAKVGQALAHKPLNVVEVNKALKEAVSRIVLNPETAELTLHWHHAPEQPTEAGPFYSRHYKGFDEPRVEDGRC